MGLQKLYTCPSCGRALCGEKRSYFVCPGCGRALCRTEELVAFDGNYCGNCGRKLSKTKMRESLACHEVQELGNKEGGEGVGDTHR